MVNDNTGGIELTSLDAVNDFVTACREDSLSTQDRSLYGAHPLVILIESTLEAVSQANLSLKIVGLSRSSERLLTQERRKLEESELRPELQQFLFCFEEVSELIRDVMYVASTDGNERFFLDLFPEWLERLRAWAAGESLRALQTRVEFARGEYLTIMNDIPLGP